MNPDAFRVFKYSSYDESKSLNLDKDDSFFSFSYHQLSDLFYKFMESNMNVLDFIYQVIKSNTQENYMIGLVLSLITLVLWLLLTLKRRLQSKALEKQARLMAAASAAGAVSGASSKVGQSPSTSASHHQSIDEKNDGHMSDSALSFFNKFGKSGPRFRKRDKLFFYGKKMLRTVSHVRGSISARSAEKSKKLYKILSKNILKSKNDEPPMYRRTGPPEFLLDTESYEKDKGNDMMPSALINLIRSVKVFGYFDQKIILEMCRYMETRTVYASNYLFKIGDPDDSIYVVESGRVHVYITDEKGTKHLIKECVEGNHIFSLLSIMDVLAGDLKPYKTVSAKAVEDTVILRLPGKAFVDVLKKYPEHLVRITQIIIVRLQRVTFTALHNYLGLTSEILRNFDNKKNKTSKRSLGSGSTQASAGSSSNRHYHHHHYHHYRHGGGKHEEQEAAEPGDHESQKLTMDDEASSKTGSQRLHHGHHRHRHHDSESFDVEHGNPNDFKQGRKYSIPLPPVGFFVDDSDSGKAILRAKQVPEEGQKSSQESLKEGQLEERTPVSTMKHSSPMDIPPPKLSSGKSRRSKAPAGSESGSETCGSFETINSRSSSYDQHSNGSEFGESLGPNDLSHKLPEVQKEIAQILKLDDPTILEGKVTIMSVSEGTILCREGDYKCNLMFVLIGFLEATQKELNGDESTVFYCHQGQMCGNLSVISGETSLFTIKATQLSEIAMINKQHFHQIIAQQPTVVLTVANNVVRRMSPFVRQIDFALEWNLIESGNALFRQDNKAESTYIVLNGRLRSILKTESNKQLVGEFGRGDLVGIVEILMETNNATTVVAIRDTEVAQIPSGLLSYIKYRHPRVVSRLMQMLSSKLLGTIQNVPSTPYIDSSYSLRQPFDAPTIVSNLCTVAIMPVSEDVPLSAFTAELCHALSAIDNTLLLTKDMIVKKLGPSALERVNEYRLCAWLGQQEDHHRIVLYQCEYRLTPWTRRCMRQADCLLIVGLASNQPTVGQLEKEIDNFAIRAQKELILLHRMDGSRPTNTVNWLNIRSWCTSHHHIRCKDRVFKTGISEKQKMKIIYDELDREKPDKNSDFSRLARFLTGTSIGLVLGGGGARGAAHVGMIKSMLEANIPIDMIGGTSIGSFMGALWAEENNFERFYQRSHEWSMKMTSYGRQILDLTYPVTSMFTGQAFNTLIEEVFGNRQIEDLWIPYFCITTDISASKMRIHMNGVIWRYVRASMTYCWLLPPLCDPLDGHLLVDGCYVNNLPGSLWRYIRASMSLSGYLPPLCDPIDGHLLLDGGYVNNLPADVMHRMGVNNVLAVDVGSKDDDNFTNYGDSLSGWWLLWKRWNRWTSTIKVPDLTEIQSRLAYVSCQRGLEIVKNSSYCEYMRPPIDRFRTLQFGSYEEIKECGYNYGKTLFDAWVKHAGTIEKFLYRKTNQPLNQFNANKPKSTPTNNQSRPPLSRLKSNPNKYHFDDLSQYVMQQQPDKTNEKRRVSILKQTGSNPDFDALNPTFLMDADSSKYAKNVKIKDNGYYFDRLCSMISNENSSFDIDYNESDLNAFRSRYDEDDIDEDEDDYYDEDEEGEETDIYGSSGSGIYVKENSSLEEAARMNQIPPKIKNRSNQQKRKLSSKSLDDTHDSVTPTRESVNQKESTQQKPSQAPAPAPVSQQLFSPDSSGKSSPDADA